jgi:hypothetical protein
MCIDVLESDSTRMAVARDLAQRLLSIRGVATLDRKNPAFNGSGSGGPAGAVNGPVWTWLAGPATYVLTRIDRQDLIFPVCQYMAKISMSQDMIGTLPTMLSPGPAGVRASLLGMAEYLRTMYQDYLGLRVDAASNLLMIQPKLPDDLTSVDATLRACGQLVTVSYRRSARDDRILIDPAGLTRPLKVGFLWMLKNGNAWRGSTRLQPGVQCTIVMTNEEIVLFQGDEEAKLDSKRELRNFSQRKATAALLPDIMEAE